MNDRATRRGTVLVTGATGFIGLDLTARLAAAGWYVRAAARDPGRVPERPGIERRVMPDLSGTVDWRPLVEGADAVVHLAGIAHASESIPEAVYRAVNGDAAGQLAVAAQAAGARAFVLMSSVRAQCGPSAVGALTEARTAEPSDAYGRAKLEGERLVAEALAGSAVPACILRPVVVYGPGVKGNMAALARMSRSPWPLPLGGLNARRSLLGLVNLAAAVEQALERPAEMRGAFLLADPGPLTLPAMIAAMRKGLDRGPRVVPLPAAPLKAALTLAGRAQAWERIAGELVVDTAALERTGWRPREIAAEGLARWMREGGG